MFGVVFCGEQAEADALHGEFALYVFPDPEDPLLDHFPLAALQAALNADYRARIRELSLHAAELVPFRLGTLFLGVRYDGTGLEVEVCAPARLRTFALDGVPVPGDGADSWLIEPGGLETDLPAFRLLLPLFAVLTATTEARFEESALLTMGVEPWTCNAFDAAGNMRPFPEATGRLLRLTARLGKAVPCAAANSGPARSLSRLPLRHVPKPEEGGALPVLHILTGFLGSGKTTFLRRWLDFLHGRERYTGVLQNEFGEIGLDAALLEGDTRVEALDEGCVCCSLADSLRPGLLRLRAQMPAEQFILETTGLANPANVLEALGELDDLVLPGLVVTVVDALDLCRGQAGSCPADITGVRRAQVERADVLIANKADAVSEPELAAVLDRLRALNPQALILPGREGNVAFAELDAFHSVHLDREAARLPSRRIVLDRPDRAVTHMEEGYGTLTVRPDGPVSTEDIRALLDRAGPGLCRAKGVVDLEGTGPVTLQYAAGRLEFEPAPRNAEERFVVLIGTGMRRPGAFFAAEGETDGVD